MLNKCLKLLTTDFLFLFLHLFVVETMSKREKKGYFEINFQRVVNIPEVWHMQRLAVVLH